MSETEEPTRLRLEIERNTKGGPDGYILFEGGCSCCTTTKQWPPDHWLGRDRIISEADLDLLEERLRADLNLIPTLRGYIRMAQHICSICGEKFVSREETETCRECTPERKT